MAINIARREFIAALGGTAVAWPLAAHSQQADRMRRVGVLESRAADDPEGQARLAVAKNLIALKPLSGRGRPIFRVDL
jgi:hypothetical protein